MLECVARKGKRMRNIFLSGAFMVLFAFDAYAVTIGNSAGYRANSAAVTQDSSLTPPPAASVGAPQDGEKINEINHKRDVCLSHASGSFDTFVWAARDSNINDYRFMVEDVRNPENNVCFVKISVQNSDERVDTHDIPSRYFVVGERAVCGNWLPEDDLKQRILNATKKNRVLGAVATSIVSAGVGVGVSEAAMAIAAKNGSDSKVLGQAALSGQELLISQIKELERKNSVEYNRVISALKTLDETCDKEWKCEKPAECNAETNPFRKLRDKLL